MSGARYASKVFRKALDKLNQTFDYVDTLFIEFTSKELDELF